MPTIEKPFLVINYIHLDAKALLWFRHQYSSGISKRRHLSLGLRCRFSKCIFMSRCCKDRKTFSKTNKVFIFLHHQIIKQKTSQARYNLTRFADFNVPRHPVFPCHPFSIYPCRGSFYISYHYHKGKDHFFLVACF